MSSNTLLLIVDAQIDFCHPEGALYVPGGAEDMERITQLIQNKSDEIDEIIVTLDSHQVLDIAHPGYWRDEKGNPPQPFTVISSQDLENGKWQPIWEDAWTRTYLTTLEQQGEFSHVIWPEHCILGTKGHALDPNLAAALTERAKKLGKNHQLVMKGLNPFTEHFGLFEAQVPRPDDEATHLNQKLLSMLASYDQIWVCGEARSHCVATSVKQILKYAPHLVAQITLLSDCMSDVAGLGHLADPIYQEAENYGAKWARSTDL